MATVSRNTGIRLYSLGGRISAIERAATALDVALSLSATGAAEEARIWMEVTLSALGLPAGAIPVGESQVHTMVYHAESPNSIAHNVHTAKELSAGAAPVEATEALNSLYWHLADSDLKELDYSLTHADLRRAREVCAQVNGLMSRDWDTRTAALVQELRHN